MAKRSGQAKASAPKPSLPQPEPAFYAGWTRDTVSVADAVQQHRNKRYNPSDLIARCEGTIEMCVRLRALAANAVPIRLYTKASTPVGKRWGKSLSRKQLATIRTPRYAGKATGYAEGSGEVVEVEWHPVMELLSAPNHFQSGQEYDLLLWDHELCGGTSYEYVVERDGMPVALLPLYLAWVTPQPSVRDMIGGYWYYRGTPAETFYPASDVNAYRLYPDRNNPYVGRSPLRSVIRQADTASAIIEEALRRIMNDCRPEQAWVSDAPMTVTQQQEAEQRLQKYRGPKNKGKPVVLGGLKPYPMQFSYKDMEWKVLDEAVNRSVRNAYFVPESFADLNSANLASAETGESSFFTFGVEPDLRMRAEQRTDMLLRRFGVQRGEMWFAPDRASDEDEDRMSQIYERYVRSNVLTVNEVRAELGYEPLEYGDSPIVIGSVGMQPTEDEPIDVESTEVAEGDAPALPAGEKPVQDTALNGAQVTALAALMESVVAGRLPVDAAIAAARMSFPTVPEETINATFEPLRNFKPTPEPTPEAPNAASNAANADAPKDKPDDESPSDGAEPVGAKTGTDTEAVRTWATMGDADLADALRKADGISVRLSHEEWIKGVEQWRQIVSDAASGRESVRIIDLNTLNASGFWFRDDHGTGCECEKHKAIPADSMLLTLLREWYEEWGPDIAMAEGAERAAVAADARRVLATILRPELARLYAEGLGQVLGQAGQPAPESLSDAAVRGIDAYVSRLSGNVTETVLVDVQAAIETSIREGMNGTAATRAVADAMGVQADWRAERVARTETGRAMEYGRLQGLDEVGVERKQWLLSSAPCQFCESAVAILRTRAPQGVPLNEPFFRAGDTIIGTAGGTMVVDQDVMVPSDLHPNDACAVSGVWNT